MESMRSNLNEARTLLDDFERSSYIKPELLKEAFELLTLVVTEGASSPINRIDDDIRIANNIMNTHREKIFKEGKKALDDELPRECNCIARPLYILWDSCDSGSIWESELHELFIQVMVFIFNDYGQEIAEHTDKVLRKGLRKKREE